MLSSGFSDVLIKLLLPFFPCNSGFTNMTFSPLVLMVHCCSKNATSCCIYASRCSVLLHAGCNNVVAPCVQQVKSMFPSKNNKLLFLLYLIFKDLTANIKVRYLPPLIGHFWGQGSRKWPRAARPWCSKMPNKLAEVVVITQWAQPPARTHLILAIAGSGRSAGPVT